MPFLDPEAQEVRGVSPNGRSRIALRTRLFGTRTTTTVSSATITGADQNHIINRGGNNTAVIEADADESYSEKVAVSETKLVNLLRLVLVLLLVSVTAVVSVGVYRLTKNVERDRFERHVELYSSRIIESFQHSILERFQAISAMATSITSHALTTGQSFPMVTVPDFEVRGSSLRVLAQTHVIHYAPVVHDSQRTAWEQYALDHRGQIDQAFQSDTEHRQRQDMELGYSTRRSLQSQDNKSSNNNTVLNDGTGFHPKLWSNGAITPQGDEPEGSGPYLPLWQRSPISAAKQTILNLNFANSRVLKGVFTTILEKKEAVITEAALPIPSSAKASEANLAISQYRHEEFQFFAQDAVSFFAYPIMESFAPDANVGGLLLTNMYWRLILSDALPPMSGSFVVVLENSFNQTLSYLLEGPHAYFLGEYDLHDPEYDTLMSDTDLNKAYSLRMSNPSRRSYTERPLSMELGRYTLRVYPTNETEEMFATNNPWIYTWIVVAVSLITSIIFAAFVVVVERRQSVVMDRVVKNAEKAAAAERDLNEFLAHEIRNPLASAIVAHDFAASSFAELASTLGLDDEVSSVMAADHKIIRSSLQFIDDFLKSMLLMYRATANKLEIGLSPTNLYKKVFEPVGNILHPRNDDITITIDCPKDLI
eukprot:scaffold38405_cov221-Amphora_coffeaeformis.AAC.1